MTIPRVRYAERQVVRSADLNAEQFYRIVRRWRHCLTGHDWGIVFGLAVCVDESGPTVQPGMAIDGFGRELVLAHPYVLDPMLWADDLSQQESNGSQREFDVWLHYCRVPFTSGGRRAESRAQSAHNRWQETAIPHVLPVVEVNQDPRYPPIPESDASFAPPADPPDDPSRKWPVFLGRLKQSGPGSAYDPMPMQRPYARLRGASVTAASGLARMELNDDTRHTRFVVTFPNRSGEPSDEKLSITEPGEMVVQGNTSMLSSPNGIVRGNFELADRNTVEPSDLINLADLRERLATSSNPVVKALWNTLRDNAQDDLQPFVAGTVSIKSKQAAEVAKALSAATEKLDPKALIQMSRDSKRPLPRMLRSRSLLDTDSSTAKYRLLQQSLAGDLAVSATGEPPSWTLKFQPLPSAPAAAAPWRMYRTVVTENGKNINQLRIELAHPGDKDDPSFYRFAIGHQANVGDDKDNTTQFEPCLVVQADGTVFIYNEPDKLNVGGQIVQGPIQADPEDPRFAPAIFQQAARGVPSTDQLTLSIAFDKDPNANSRKSIPSYTVKFAENDTPKKRWLCALYESVYMDQKLIRVGSVGEMFRIEPNSSGNEVRLTRPSGVVDTGAIVSALVFGIDDESNATEAQASETAP